MFTTGDKVEVMVHHKQMDAYIFVFGTVKEILDSGRYIVTTEYNNNKDVNVSINDIQSIDTGESQQSENSFY